MLVLARHVGERIVIGDGIIITVCEVRGDKVRIGIEAPREIPVHREEVLGRIRAGAAEKGGGGPSACTSSTTGS